MKDTNAELARFERAHRFADASRAAHVPLQTHFYPEGGHSGMFTDGRQREDEVRRIVKFLRKELRWST
jgi:acetyl esterase/lipase